MRGTKAPQSSMLCLISTESRIPERHPLRAVKNLVDAALKDLGPVLEGMYSKIDGRTSRHEGYRISQRFRKRIEEVFGWEKTVAGFRKTRFRGKRRNEMATLLIGAAYNLLRMARLMLTIA